MPGGQKKKLIAGSGPQEKNSVYDFLYHDARRVGSFLAQLDPNGHLQRLRKSAQTLSTTGSKSTIKGGGGVPGIAQIGHDAEDATSEQHGNSADREYDPLWANALALLDHLEQRKLFSRNPHEAGLGQLVLITGFLKVINLKLLENVWGTASVSKLQDLNNSDLDERQRIDNEVGLDIVKQLPHNVQAILYVGAEPGSVSWMILDDDSLVVPASTILLKYGNWVAGEWSVLCIKDANIDDGPIIDEELQNLMAQGWEAAAEQRHSTPFALLSEMISPVARKAMGRPGIFYGVTPILIFRELTPCS